MARVDLTAAGIVHDVALEVLEDDPYPTYAWMRRHRSTLSHLLHDGMPEGTTRSIDEIIGDIGVMIVGGFQEPAHGAANSLHGLFTRPEQAERLRANPVRKLPCTAGRYGPPSGCPSSGTPNLLAA
jgi:hypothetical protein